MSTSLLTHATKSQLTRTSMPAGKDWFDVPDIRLSADQQKLIFAAKTHFGVEEQSTFCMGVKKDSTERVIVQPKIVKDGESIAIRWGKKSYPLELEAIEDVFTQESDNTVYATVGGYTFPVSFLDLSKMAVEKLTKTQKAFRALEKADSKARAFKKYNLAQMLEVLRAPTNGFAKLREMDQGEYTVIGYKLSPDSLYGTRYTLTLEDGRTVDSNTALKTICAVWDELDVEVTPEKPATLVIGGQRETKTGKLMVMVELYSYSDMQLETFDFSDFSESTEEPNFGINKSSSTVDPMLELEYEDNALL